MDVAISAASPLSERSVSWLMALLVAIVICFESTPCLTGTTAARVHACVGGRVRSCMQHARS